VSICSQQSGCALFFMQLLLVATIAGQSTSSVQQVGPNIKGSDYSPFDPATAPVYAAPRSQPAAPTLPMIWRVHAS
jgi:hypothetical protein